MEKLYSQARGDTSVPRAVLTRRPDLALFDVEASVEDLAAAPALSLLSKTVMRLAASLPAFASLTKRDFAVPSIPGLLKAEPAAARLSFHISVPLSAVEFEERANRLALVDDALRAWLLECKKSKPAVAVRRQRPVCILSDGALEAARKDLVASWHARASELEQLGRVKIKNVRMGAAVSQVPVGVDAVELTLDLGGTVTLVTGREKG
jgi:hypothetical protein